MSDAAMTDGVPSHALQTTPALPVGAHHARPGHGPDGTPSLALSADAHHVRLEQKRFLTVYAVLVAGTVLTVAMYYVHFEAVWQTVSVALLIAAAKAACVAAVFMHLWHGERHIHSILLYTGVVVAGLFGLTVFSLFSVPGAGLFPR